MAACLDMNRIDATAIALLEPLEATKLHALFRLALAHLVHGSSHKALVIARGLYQFSPTEPTHAALLCTCLVAADRHGEAEPILERMQALQDGGGRAVALSVQLLAAAVHWRRGRHEQGEAALRRYLAAARIC